MSNKVSVKFAAPKPQVFDRVAILLCLIYLFIFLVKLKTTELLATQDMATQDFSLSCITKADGKMQHLLHILDKHSVTS